MSIQLAKTVYIGLGGTGAKSILKTKAMMLENYGEIPPMIKFLVLDTDTRDKVSLKDNKGKNVMFDNDEFIHMTLPNVKRYNDANPSVTKFLPSGILEKRTSIVEGAGQFRSVGRLAFLSQIDVNFLTSISNAISSVRNWTTGRDDKYSVTDGPIKIMVVFSIAGGTGAGSFIDFPLMLRGLIPGLTNDEKITAVGLLPDVYSSLGFAAINCKPNAITGITEYEFIADNVLDAYSESMDPGRIANVSASTSYNVDKDNLYNSFFLVNNRSDSGNIYNSVDELTSFIGRNLYLISGRAGGSGNSSLDNLETIGAGSDLKGKQMRYFGMGAAEMFLDTDKLSDYYALNQISLLSQNITSGTVTININQEINEKVALWQIKEDQGDDHVITAISESKPKIGFSNLDQFDEDANISIKNKRDAWIQSQKAALNSLIYGTNGNGTLSKYLGDKLNLLQQHIDEKIALPGGLEFSRLFLNNLIGRMNAMRDEMNLEKESFDKKLSDLEVVFINLIADIKSSESISKFNVFKSRSKEIERACEEYVLAVNFEITAIYERERRIAASHFYKSLIEKSEKLLANIDNFKVQMEQLSKRVSSELQTIKSRTSLDPFCIFVDKYAIERNNIGKEDVDVPGFLNNVNLTSLVNGGYSVDQLYDKFKSYTSGLKKYLELKNTGILDELEKMDMQDLDRLVRQLKNSVGIMRNLNTAETFEKAEIFTIGVHDKNHDSLKHSDNNQDDNSKTRVKKLVDAFNDHFSYLNKNPEFSNTYDKKRIVVGCYQSGVPAFVVGNFNSYYSEFQNKNTEAQKMMFSNKYWADKIINFNYSIFPKSDENTLKAWVLAIVATKVEIDNGRATGGLFFDKEENGNYFVYSQSGSIRENTKMVDLGFSDRFKAYNIFKDKELSKELINEVKRRIKDNILIYQTAFKDLADNPDKYVKEYANHKLSDVSYNGQAYSATKKLVEQEYDFIKNFVVGNELASL